MARQGSCGTTAEAVDARGDAVDGARRSSIGTGDLAYRQHEATLFSDHLFSQITGLHVCTRH